MLAEIHEKDATGEIARIYAEVRELWGVPYVSAIQRHLATRPGVLEWAWAAVAPAFRGGLAQEAAWACAAGLGVAPLDPISSHAQRLWGMEARDTAAAREVALGFVRVAPVNMAFAALVKALLSGETGRGAAVERAAWSPPAPLSAPPAMVDLAGADAALRGAMLAFATPSDGKPFVPGLYRMLGHWPGLLAHLETVLAPRLARANIVAACDLVRKRVDAAVPAVLATLSPDAGIEGRPGEDERTHFLAIGATYRKTSPELIVAGRLIADALA